MSDTVQGANASAFDPRRIGRGVWRATSRSAAWPLLVTLCIFFALQSSSFLDPYNINIIFGQTVLIGVLAVGLTPLAISGNVDLSVGAIAAISTVVAVLVQAQLGIVPSMIAALAVATALGVVNGLIVEKLGLNSIIVTLAMGTALHGLAFIVFGSSTILDKTFEYSTLGYVQVFGVSISVIIFLVIAVLAAAMLRFTVQGVNTFAIGGHRQAALDAGINVERHVLINFAFSGFTAGVCGILLVMSLGAGSATLAKDYELWAIISVVLGGTRLLGGAGTVSGTIAAALSLTVLRNGMNLMKIDARWFLIALGSALIVALILDRLRSGEPETAE
ncbi:MAG TPA: ABC transporter permease [Devosia sp.]|nr:ABC transporter permease [Devosia sp.]